VEELPHLSAFLAGPRILVKRDDQTGLAFGGNKTRKLEYLLAEALSHGAKTLITAGAIQSNHCRQTAAVARRAGLECILVLNGQPPEFPEANTYLDILLGAEIIWTDLEIRNQTLSAVTQQAEADGRQPFLIPYGGSSPVGAVAYAFAMQEMLEQGHHPDWIVFATSSGGTHAGLVAGARKFGFHGRVQGISIDYEAAPFKQLIADLARETSVLLGDTESYLVEDILVNDDYLGEGYAVMGAPERESIALFARYEGLLVDPVYTGRAAAGMLDLIRKGIITKNETVLFWHTGGTPALFDSKYAQGLL
jgi:D-cysteine desulfhydrase family pyridoxal phosphate-dependent enzyme